MQLLLPCLNSGIVAPFLNGKEDVQPVIQLSLQFKLLTGQLSHSKQKKANCHIIYSYGLGLKGANMTR